MVKILLFFHSILMEMEGDYRMVWAEETFQGHPVQPPCIEQGHLQVDVRSLRTLSNLVLNVFRNGASTTSLGNMWQCITI